ncbi:MAG: PAS domain S-box protein [Anaerolineae bacterium]
MFTQRTWKRAEALFWRFTQPSSDLKHEEQRYLAQSLAACSMAVIAALCIICPIWITSSPHFSATPYVSLGLLMAFMAAYELSRTRFYEAGAVVVVAAIFILVDTTILIAPGAVGARMLALNFLSLAAIVSSMFLRRRDTVLVIASGLAIIGVFFFLPEVPFSFAFSYLVFVALISLVGWGVIEIGNQNRKRLAQSEERFRAATESSLDAFCVLESVRDTQGEIVDFRIAEINQNAARQTPLSPAELKNHLLCELFPGLRNYGLFEQYKQVVLTGEPSVQEYQVPEGCAALGWYQQQAVKVGDGVAIASRDITARKHADEALRNSETNFRTLFNSIKDFLFVLDIQGNIIEINQTVITRLGYTAEELINQSVLNVHPKERRTEAAQIVDEMLQGSRSFCPVPIQAKSQELIPVETYITQGLWNGQPALFGVTKDISDIKMSEEKFAAVFHANPAIAGLSRVDTGVYVEVNRAFCEKLGFTPAEVIGKPSTHLLHLDDQYRQVVIEKLKRDGFVRDEEAVIYTKDGTPISVMLTAQTLFLHGVAYNFTTAIDITEHKRIEKALRESNERHQALLNAIPDLVFRNRRDGVFIDYHARNPRELLVPPEQFMGRPIGEILPPKHAESRTNSVARVLETGQEQVHEYSLSIGGELMDFEARMVVCGQDEVLTIVRNITKIKTAQRREFELALEKERHRMLTAFIQTATHEFRTPLATIGTSLYLLTRSEDPLLRQEKKAQIETEIKRITRLIDMLLLMMKLDNEELPPAERIDVNNHLRSVCSEVTALREMKRILDCKLQPDLPELMGRADYLSAAFKELLENACRYSPQNSTIRITTAAAADHVRIDISDQGSGISEDQLPHIFETFWRQDKAHTTPGFGLGLPIAQKIVRMHNGRIEVKTETGKGTTLTVMIPI